MRYSTLLFLLCVPVGSAISQTPAGSFAGLEGVAVDSLRGGFLRGATVSISGTTRVAFTDSTGRFKIDSVPPGLHQVELFHELLDTLAIRVFTPQLSFARDSVTTLILGVPSPQTIIRAKCAPDAEDPAALLGMVLDAEREEPVAGAEVRLAWVELTIGERSGLQSRPELRTTTTDAAGRYRFCGLPKGVSAEITAVRGSDSTSTVQMVYGESLLGMATLLVAKSLPAVRDTIAPPAAASPAAVVRGIVVDSTGRPVPGAHVGLSGNEEAAITDSSGRFALTAPRSGTQSLIVRRLGFQPSEMVVNLTPRRPVEVRMDLKTYVPVIEAVVIAGRRNLALERVGFVRRQRAGWGRYLTEQEIQRRNAFRISDYLQMMPNLRVDGRGNVTAPFGRCVRFFVDGNRFGNPDNFIMPDEVAAIEVYRGDVTPAEFKSWNPCETVIIWTKWKLGVR